MTHIMPRKIGATMKISEEQLFAARGLRDPRYLRRHTKNYTPAPPEAWERYRAAVAGLAALEAYEGTMMGGPDYGTEVPPPEPTLEIEYLETAEEWIARCRTMAAEDRDHAETEWAAAAGQWARK